MQIKLEFNIKPLTVNLCFRSIARGKRVMNIKSEAYRNFEDEINKQINKFRKELSSFNNHYNDNAHYIDIEYRFYFPIFTKSQKLHKRAGDVDNLIKAIKDCVFKELDADDGEVVNLSATKIHSEDPKILMIISVKDLTLLH